MATFCVNVIRSGFLDHRPPRADLFPLFYPSDPSSLNKRRFTWTPDELAFVKDLYDLWHHTAMLLFRKGSAPVPWSSPDFLAFIRNLSSIHFGGGLRVSETPYQPRPWPSTPVPDAPEFYIKLVWEGVQGDGDVSLYTRQVAAAMYACEIRKTKPSDRSVSNSTGARGTTIHAKALPGGDRKGLSEPHMYIYSTETPRRTVSGPVLCPPTELERRYESGPGYMCRIPPGGLTLDLPEGGLGVSIFYKVDSGTIVPVYDVMSRGFIHSSHGSLTTFAGPMNFNYKMDPDQFVVTRDFEYIPDYQITFDSEESDSRKSIILNPVEINKYSESLYEIVNRAGVTEAQSFIYRGLDVICPMPVLAFLEPDCLPTEMFEASLDRMYARRGITPEHFISLLSGPTGLKDPLELKQVVIEAINLVNTLTYRNDTVFGREVDVHQNIRLTNSDDCDGGAEGMFRIMQGIKTESFRRSARRDDTRALGVFFEKITPLFMHMRIDYAKSNSHSIAAGVVLDEEGRPDKRYQMFMMEGTGPEHASFCSIDEARCDPDATRWRIAMSKSISSPLEYYHEPCDGPWGGDKFYKGFIGAVPGSGPKGYRFFVREEEGLENLKNNGVGLCEVAMEGSYKLVGPDLSADATAELRRLAGFVPPLPVPKGDGSFPEEYKPYLERIRTTVHANGKGKGGAGDESPAGGLPPAAFTMFLNLCITEGEFEKAVRMLEKLEGYSKAEVHGYSTFPGTAIIEINIR